ncbi:MAG: 30S ribosome-binding factor RbfA [Flavobacteriaceae bacterium]|nr:30S ribosome-binding factor RbfA [Flavobacteriaceae bacterium]
MEETNRQKKIAGVLQNDLAIVLQKMLLETGQKGVIISVTKVTVTTDLSLSKVFVSVFPSDNASLIVTELNENKPRIKNEVAQKTKHQLRKMPDLVFYNDDSLDYINSIGEAIKGEENPIKDTDLLQKRKKI